MKDIKYKSARDYFLNRDMGYPDKSIHLTLHQLKKIEREQELSNNPKIRELEYLNILIIQFEKIKKKLLCISNAHFQLSPEIQEKLEKEINKRMDGDGALKDMTEFTDPRPEAAWSGSMMDIKKLVKDFLIRLGIITEKFTGEIVVVIGEGGVRAIFKQKEKVI